jgi:hypothetical protein
MRRGLPRTTVHIETKSELRLAAREFMFLIGT